MMLIHYQYHHQVASFKYGACVAALPTHAREFMTMHTSHAPSDAFNNGVVQQEHVTHTSMWSSNAAQVWCLPVTKPAGNCNNHLLVTLLTQIMACIGTNMAVMLLSSTY
jgi:hypothetical protein